MSTTSRSTSADFSHGNVRATLTFENGEGDVNEYMVDNTLLVASKEVGHLIVRLDRLVQVLEHRGTIAEPTGIREPIIEKVEVTVFGTTVKFEIAISLNPEFGDATSSRILEELPRYYAVGFVSSRVIEAAMGNLAQHGGNRTMDEIIESEEPLFAFLGGLGPLLNSLENNEGSTSPSPLL